MNSAKPALRSGLDADSQFVLGESREEFAQLQDEYFSRFAPTTPEQRFQVDNLIRNEWLLRRYHRVESHLWEYQISLCDRAGRAQLGQAYTKASTVFARLHRTITAVEKAYKAAMEELTRLQQDAEPPELASFLTAAPKAPQSRADKTHPSSSTPSVSSTPSTPMSRRDINGAAVAG